MSELERIGVSIESSLLSEFDKIIEKHGYQNRSEAIRDLVREKISDEELKKPNTTAIAAVFIVYDHHASKLWEKLVSLQHSHFLKTISSMHIHLSHHDCLEIIILKGKVREISKLGDEMLSIKGVKLGKINLVAAQ